MFGRGARGSHAPVLKWSFSRGQILVMVKSIDSHRSFALSNRSGVTIAPYLKAALLMLFYLVHRNPEQTIPDQYFSVTKKAFYSF